MTEEERAEAEASAKRLSAYAEARQEWESGRETWDRLEKTAAYEWLSKLWSAMNRLEQKCAGMEAVMLYHRR